MSRTVEGYLLTWGWRVLHADAKGDPYCTILLPSSLSRWWRTHPEGMPVDVDHRGVAVGRFVDFRDDGKGIYVRATVDDGTAEAADAGVLSGFSYTGFHRRLARGQDWRGVPSFDVVELDIDSAGLCQRPADDRARVLRVNGRDPAYLERQVRAILRGASAA